MILSTRGRYAVMSLVDIAVFGQNSPVKLESISLRQGLDQGYLEQIFSKLKKSGIVIARKGPGGGYILGRNMADISIADIMFAVDENIKMTRCEKNSPQGCLEDKSRCVTHHLWEGLGEHIYKFLRDISLEDVCRKRLKKTECGNYNSNENAA